MTGQANVPASTCLPPLGNIQLPGSGVIEDGQRRCGPWATPLASCSVPVVLGNLIQNKFGNGYGVATGNTINPWGSALPNCSNQFALLFFESVNLGRVMHLLDEQFIKHVLFPVSHVIGSELAKFQLAFSRHLLGERPSWPVNPQNRLMRNSWLSRPASCDVFRNLPARPSVGPHNPWQRQVGRWPCLHAPRPPRSRSHRRG